MENYRVGIIGDTGNGDYGHNLDMAYRDIPGAKVAAVSDADAEGLKKAGRRHGTDVLYQDYREMLAKEQLDLISVCPRFPLKHQDMVIAAAESGAKGIFCEKPFATTLAEADTMLEACDRHNVRVVVAHRRVCGNEIHAKKLVQQGVIGDVQVLRTHGKSDHRSGGQDLAVLGPHMMDSMRWFADADTAWVNGHVMQDGREVTIADAHEGDETVGMLAGNAISAYFAFKNGVVGHHECFPGFPTQKSGHVMVFGLDVYGTKGIISLRGSPGGEIHLYNDGFWIPGADYAQWKKLEPDNWDSAGDTGHQSNHLIAEELIQAVEKNRKVQNASSGHDARAALEMIMAVHESHLTKKRVELPLTNRENPYGSRN